MVIFARFIYFRIYMELKTCIEMATENPILPALYPEHVSKAEDAEGNSGLTPEVPDSNKRLRLQNPGNAACRAGRTRSVRRRGAQCVSEAPAEETVAERLRGSPPAAGGARPPQRRLQTEGAPAEVPAAEVPAAGRCRGPAAVVETAAQRPR